MQSIHRATRPMNIVRTALRAFLACLLSFQAAAAQGAQGRQALDSIKQCVMLNDIGFCHAHMTPASREIFDRFFSYKLMPCLPTNISYVAENQRDGALWVKGSIPESPGAMDIFWLAFQPSAQGGLLDLPQTLRKGFGPGWQNKIAMAEQIYLMMRQNMGDKLNCDTLGGLLKPGAGR